MRNVGTAVQSIVHSRDFAKLVADRSLRVGRCPLLNRRSRLESRAFAFFPTRNITELLLSIESEIAKGINTLLYRMFDKNILHAFYLIIHLNSVNYRSLNCFDSINVGKY